MDNTKDDNLAKGILSGSKLKLSNPDFNKILMGKIRLENRKRNLMHNIKLYSLIFVSIDVILIVLLNLLNVRLSDISIKISTLSNGFKNSGSNSVQLILIYFIVLSVIIFVFNMITDVGNSNSKPHEG